MLDSAFVALQYILPRHWLTSVIWRVARIRNPRVKNFLITQFARAFDVNLEEVKLAVPGDFATCNEFFIRELRDQEVLYPFVANAGQAPYYGRQPVPRQNVLQCDEEAIEHGRLRIRNLG